MITLLLKLFVKDYRNTADTKVKAAYGKLASAVGVAANALLCAFKFAGGLIAGSAAMLSDAANNLSDVTSSVIALVGIKLAAKPADEKHPFGHGRYEYVLSLIISFFVLFMGAELVKNSVEKIIHPSQLQFSFFALAVPLASILVKLWMGFFNLALAKKANLASLKAVATDSFSDCICTLAVVASLLCYRLFSWNIDGYIGAAVALIVIRSGIGILKDSLDLLIGKPADKKTVESIKSFITDFDADILGVHDLMLHDYGMGRVFAVAHAEVPDSCNLVKIHDLIDSIEKQVTERFGIHLVLHIDPVDVHNNELEALKQKVAVIVKSVDEHYTIHDFRLSEDGKTMFFDLVIDSDIRRESDAIGQMVKARILAALGDAVKPVITVEFPFAKD